MSSALPQEFLSKIIQENHENIEFGVQATKQFPMSYRKIEIMGLVVLAIYFILFLISMLEFEFNKSSPFDKFFTPIVIIIVSFIFYQKASFIKIKDLYFAGTKTALFSWCKGKIEKKEWKDFTETIKVNEKDNFGDVIFKLKELSFEQTVQKIFTPSNSSMSGSVVFAGGQYSICGISNPRQIADICLSRIKESQVKI